MKKIVVLGGGFGGMYAAMELEKVLSPGEAEITLVSKDNYLLFTPMLHEVASGDVSITDIVCPVRQLVKRTTVLQGLVTAIDIKRKRVSVSHCSGTESDELEFDYLLIALGSVTNFFGLPGLQENAVTMKTLDDAMHLRNLMIACLEEAEFDVSMGRKQPLLTFIVAGAGFAGVETVAGMNDFLREAMPRYKHLHDDMLRVVLVDMIKTPLPELGQNLGAYAAKKLAQRKVELIMEVKVQGISARGLELDNGSAIKANVIVWTAGVAPSPVLRNVDCRTERGRIVCNEFLEALDAEGIWAIGDSALVTDPFTGKPYPPTAQHATREGSVAARNIVASLRGKPKSRRPFAYKTMGSLVAIGRRAGVANIMGMQFSGFIAWFLWRSIYLMKLPGLDRKTRVALAWGLDLFFRKDFVQFMQITTPLIQNDEAQNFVGVRPEQTETGRV